MSSNNNSKPFKLPTFADYIASYRPQQFSIPYSIIHYIAKNPKKSEVYQKLIQCCKCFFVKNPILVIPSLWCEGGEEWNICRKFDYKKKQSVKKFELKQLFGKLWITKELIINVKRNSVAAGNLIRKLCHCDVKEIVLVRINMSVDEFNFLSRNCKNVTLHNVNIINDKGLHIPLEVIFSSIPNLLQFNYKFCPEFKTFSKNTLTELLEMPRFHNLEIFKLHNLPELFDVEKFFNFVKNTGKWGNLVLSYDIPLSEEYIKKLEKIIEEMYETNNRNDFNYAPIMIGYEEQTDEENEKLYRIYDRFFY